MRIQGIVAGALLPCVAWGSPAIPDPPAASADAQAVEEPQETCQDDLLGEAKDQEENGYFAIAAELYVEAYRTCLADFERLGPLGSSVVFAAVEMYKQAALRDDKHDEMLGRAKALLEQHLRLLDERPSSVSNRELGNLRNAQVEIDLLAVGAACRRDPEACSSIRGPGRRAVGLAIGGGVTLLGGAVLTSIGATGVRFQEIRLQDNQHGTMTEEIRAENRADLERQRNMNYVILGVGLGLVVVGTTLLAVGLVRGRKNMQPRVSPQGTGANVAVLHF